MPHVLFRIQSNCDLGEPLRKISQTGFPNNGVASAGRFRHADEAQDPGFE
jgi:hypothetical protein